MPRSAFSAAYASLLATLVAKRKGLGVTQVVLSERLGKPQSFISKVEQGSRRIDVVEFYAIMKALGADPSAEFEAFVRKLPERVDI